MGAMTWIRLQHRPHLVVNLERYVRVEAVGTGPDGSWAVQAVPARPDEAPITTIFQGSRPDCQAVVDEIAKVVWAMEVPGSLPAPAQPVGQVGQVTAPRRDP